MRYGEWPRITRPSGEPRFTLSLITLLVICACHPSPSPEQPVERETSPSSHPTPTRQLEELEQRYTLTPMRANSTEHMTIYRAPNEEHDTLVGVASNGELVEGMASLETTSHPEHIARDALGVTVSPGPSSCACDGEGTCKEFVEQ